MKIWPASREKGPSDIFFRNLVFYFRVKFKEFPALWRLFDWKIQNITKVMRVYKMNTKISSRARSDVITLRNVAWKSIPILTLFYANTQQALLKMALDTEIMIYCTYELFFVILRKHNMIYVVCKI